ncbi:MAG: hypothetical protein WA691_00015 [Thermoplasmata archaeon]
MTSAAPVEAASGPPWLSAWKRDYRLSIALFLAGIVIVVTISAFSFWANMTGNYPTSFWTGLAVEVTETAGGMLILLAGTVAYYHWSFLRQSKRTG